MERKFCGKPARATILCVWVKKLGRLFSDAAAILFSKKFTAKGSLCRNSREDRPFRFGAGPQTAGPSLRSGWVGNGEMIFDILKLTVAHAQGQRKPSLPGNLNSCLTLPTPGRHPFPRPG